MPGMKEAFLVNGDLIFSVEEQQIQGLEEEEGEVHSEPVQLVWLGVRVLVN